MASRGRRQVGKSRLVQEFCNRSAVPYLFFTATKGASPTESITTLIAESRDSTLPMGPDLLPDHPPTSWSDAFRILASSLPDRPSIVVLDEVPWLSEQDPVVDGALLRRGPALLLLLGGDLHMMERLTIA